MVKNIFTHKSVNFSKTEMDDGMGPLSPLAIISLHWIERKQSWEINKPELCYFSQTLKAFRILKALELTVSQVVSSSEKNLVLFHLSCYHLHGCKGQ